MLLRRGRSCGFVNGDLKLEAVAAPLVDSPVKADDVDYGPAVFGSGFHRRGLRLSLSMRIPSQHLGSGILEVVPRQMGNRYAHFGRRPGVTFLPHDTPCTHPSNHITLTVTQPATTPP